MSFCSDQSSVTFKGILPRDLGIKLVAEADKGNHKLQSSSIQYVTPAPSIVADYRLHDRIGPVPQEWYSGLTAVRNVQEALGGLPLPKTIYQTSHLFTDCLCFANTDFGPRHG